MQQVLDPSISKMDLGTPGVRMKGAYAASNTTMDPWQDAKERTGRDGIATKSITIEVSKHQPTDWRDELLHERDKTDSYLWKKFVVLQSKKIIRQTTLPRE